MSRFAARRRQSCWGFAGRPSGAAVVSGAASFARSSSSALSVNPWLATGYLDPQSSVRPDSSMR